MGQRVGGWGELFGDEGSGVLGSDTGLNTFQQGQGDGRLARTAFALIKERLRLTADLDAVNLVIDKWSGSRSSIAALATAVCQAASAGDKAAHRIWLPVPTSSWRWSTPHRCVSGFADDETVRSPTRTECFSDDGFLGCSSMHYAPPTPEHDLRRPAARSGDQAALCRQKQRTSAEPLHYSI